MRRMAIAMAAAAVIGAASAAGLPPDLAQAAKDYDQAQMHNDRAALERLLADDYTLLNSRGEVETKAQFIAESTAPDFHLDPYVVRDPVERVWKDGAVLGGVVTLSGTDAGSPFTAALRFADVWAKRGGRWQVVYTGVTRDSAAAKEDTVFMQNVHHMHDFDFLVGNWKVRHHRLKVRLADNHEWEDFDGASSLHYSMGGYGTFDDNVINLPSGPYRAVTVRTYDPKTKLWHIWWFDGRFPGEGGGQPVIGSFKDGVGTFYGDDTFNGKPIKVRFIWSNLKTKPHWEQAFSADGGKTWETNWVMDFTRVP